MQFFSCSWSDVCLFLFLLIFPAFIDQTRALHPVFLLTVCTTGVNISRNFFESDEYLCPLTVCVVLEITYFSLQVTTHSRLLSSNDLKDIARATSLPLPNVTCLSLQQFHTEQQFCSSVRYSVSKCEVFSSLRGRK